MHGIAFGAEIGGVISAAAVATVTVPGIGLAIGAGIMIHFGICCAKYVSNKSKEKEELKQNVLKYSDLFLDNLSGFQEEIMRIIEHEKDKIIRQINDAYLLESLKFDQKEENNLIIIFNLFEKKLSDNYIFN